MTNEQYFRYIEDENEFNKICALSYIESREEGMDQLGKRLSTATENVWRAWKGGKI